MSMTLNNPHKFDVLIKKKPNQIFIITFNNYNRYNLMLSQHCLVGKVFANGPGDQGSIPGGVIPKT